jgi:short-subunit dehydrogenase
MPLALITGPTSGIGRAFATALAEQGHDLVLVSRDQARLESLARELSDDYGVAASVIAADLSRSDDLTRVEDQIMSQDIDVLVNNAGFGIRGGFLANDVDVEQDLLNVMVVAVMRLTRAALPGMVERGRGYVFTISSVAGWITGGTYSAAKAWATVFTEGLQADLAGTGVRAVAVCPGYTRTEFHARANIDMTSVSDIMWLDAGDVVAQAFRDARAGRAVSVAGLQYKALSLLLHVLPRPFIRWVGRAGQISARFGRDR